MQMKMDLSIALFTSLMYSKKKTHARRSFLRDDYGFGLSYKWLNDHMF